MSDDAHNHTDDSSTRVVAFSFGRNKRDAYPVQKTAQSFAEFVSFVCEHRSKNKGQRYFCAPFAENGDGRHHRCADGAQPRRFLPLDLDYIESGETLLNVVLALQPWTHFAYTTWSHTAQKPRLRGVVELSRAVDRVEGMRCGIAFQSKLLTAAGIINGDVKFDKSVYQGEQPCYGPLTHCEIYPRDRQLSGAPLDVDALLVDAPEIVSGVTAVDRAGRIIEADPRIQYLYDAGFVLKAKAPLGKLAIRCPNAAAHSIETSPTACVVLLPHFGGVSEAAIHCLHQSCAELTQDDFWNLAGYAEPHAEDAAVEIGDFYAFMPAHRYLFRPTGEQWPAESVNNRLPAQKVEGKKRPLKPAAWLDQFAPVEQMTWAPCEPELIQDRLIDQGGWIQRSGCRVFNLYRPPVLLPGDPAKAGHWRAHLKLIYPNEHQHIERWLAHRVQRPGEKLNHCLVLQGGQGVGKDTILEPVKQAIGPGNWSEINPAQMLGSFNPWARAVVVRVNEARDLGDFDRYAFYDHSKVYMAAPPDVLRVNAKFATEHYIPNVVGVIITTNHDSDGIYLDPDDRRHFVAGSEAVKEDFDPQYWTDLWAWYAAGGIGHVAAYLRALDLADFDAKATPPKTAAFWRIVHSNSAPEDAGLADVLEALGRPKVVTLRQLADAARERSLHDVAEFLTELKTRRSVQHRMKAAGYGPLHNQDAADGLWKLGNRRQAVYAARGVPYGEAVEALRKRGIGQ